MSLLMKMKEKKVDLKLNIQKTKIMASSSIPSWQIDEESMETVTDFIATGGDCSDKIKRRLFLGRKAMTNLVNVLKSRDLYFANKGPSS